MIPYLSIPRIYRVSTRKFTRSGSGGYDYEGRGASGDTERRGERLDNSGEETKERGERGLVLNFKRSGETSGRPAGRPTGLQSEIKR